MPKGRRINKHIAGLETGDVQTRRKCARWLGMPGNVQAVKYLCAALQDNDRHVRGQAGMSLGIIGDKAAVEPLIKLVERDTSVGAIRRAIISLGLLSDPAAVSALLKVAIKAKSKLETTARDAIDEIGLRAIGELCRSLQPTDTPLNAEAADGIARIYRRTPSIWEFPGGPVIEVVMLTDGLPPRQRLSAIEAALSSRMRYRMLNIRRGDRRIADEAAALCIKLARQQGDETISANAASVVNYISLGRASDVANQPEVLLESRNGVWTRSGQRDIGSS